MLKRKNVIKKNNHTMKTEQDVNIVAAIMLPMFAMYDAIPHDKRTNIID